MSKTIRKAIGCILLALAIAVTQIPARNVMAASDFKMDGTRIVGYTGTASVVSIPADAESIESDAFANCKSMVSLKIPKNVKVIGAGAFRGCDNLKSVTIAAGLEEIDNQAFADCKNLTSINIPATTETLESGIFAGDSSLEAVSIDLKNPKFVCRDGVIYSEDYTRMVEMCPGRKADSFALPASVATIDKYAFWGCKNLKNADISHYMGDVPAFAFSYCKGLTSMEIPPSVNNINAKAFENCRNIEDVIIPASVRYIAPNAFDGCPKLNIIAPAGSEGEKFFETFDASAAALADYDDDEDIITSSVTTTTTTTVSTNEVTTYPAGDVSKSDVSDVSYSNMGAPDLSGANVIGGTRIVGRSAVVFIDNSKMDVLDQTYTPAVTDVSGNSVSENAAVFINRKYTIVNGNTIADRSYYGDGELQDFVFPQGITKIGDFSFARSGLTQIDIPNGVTNIGYGAFYHCDNLSSIRVPNTVTSIEPSAFGRTAWLNNWISGNDSSDFLIVGDGNLIAYKGNSAVIGIPQGVKRICGEVFMNHSEITQVALPNSLLEIGEAAFHGCTNLESVLGGENLTKISDRAFYGCPIKTMTIPQNVQNLGLQAYGGNDGEAAVFLGETLPMLSCEKTATRLVNEEYRDLVFDCQVAKVPQQVNEFDNTILDERSKGFRGVVISEIMPPQANNPGTAVLKYCSLEADEAGNVNVPGQVTVNGQPYVIESMKEGAFDAYADLSWTKLPVKRIVVDGAITNGRDVNNLIDGESNANNQGGVEIIDKTGVSENRIVKASLPQTDTPYQLVISQNEEAEQLLRDAVKAQYPLELETDLYTMDLAMYDETGQIPITKLGKDKMDVTMKIPAGMDDSTLCVVTLDSNGQLETKLVDYVSVNDETCLAFEISHFSPYGILRATGELADKIDKKIGKSSGSALKDKSPDTGDYFDPKWVLALGMVCLGLILLLKKEKEVRA